MHLIIQKVLLCFVILELNKHHYVKYSTKPHGSKMFTSEWSPWKQNLIK